jgi:hypothetical protein
MEVKAITLKARSSNGSPYDVAFSVEDSLLHVTCTCQAGASHMLCKHRTELIAGDRSRLYTNPSDADWVALRALVESYGLIAALEQLQTAEAVAEEAKERVKTLRRDLGHGLDAGMRATSIVRMKAPR